MSFHGPPGTGKTYVAQMIAKSIYKNGDLSKFYHFFNGRNDFPLQKDVEQYKVTHVQYVKLSHLYKLQSILCFFFVALSRKSYERLLPKV